MDICVCKGIEGGGDSSRARKKEKEKRVNPFSKAGCCGQSYVCCVDPNKNWPQQTIQVEGGNVIEKRIFSYKNVCIKNLRAF